MLLTLDIKAYLDRCVLCWLATATKDGVPNVSPKEIFTHYGDDKIIIANIASPGSVKNILQNEQVCVSFIDILIQKGFQVKGSAIIAGQAHPDFSVMKQMLLKMTEGKFPFKTITLISVQQVKPIIAPRYLLYPETTEAEQVASAMKNYGL